MNFLKSALIISLSVMMLSVACCISFYLVQNIKKSQNEELILEPKAQIDQFYLDRFKIAVYVLLKQHNQAGIDNSRNTIEQIKQEMREQKYSELEISMLYTNATKQILNIK